jgi:hypothetical protein
MDPFSIIVGTVGLADVSIRVISYLSSLKSATSKIQDEITILGQEIEALVAVNDSVEDFWHSRHDLDGFDVSANDGSHASNVWKNLASLLQQSKGTIEQLEVLLKEVIGKKHALVGGKLDGLRKTIRRQDRDGEYMQIRQRLANNQAGIQMLLSALNLYVQGIIYGICIREKANQAQFLYAQVSCSSGPYCGLATREPAAPKQ